MTKFKKKTTTIATIYKEVAKKQGISKALAKAIVEQTFLEFSEQLCSTGYARIPGFATINISINCRTGEARGRLDFRMSKDLATFVKTLPSDRKNAEFLEYLLERDEKKHEKYEMTRLVRQQKVIKWQKYSQEMDRERIAKFVATQFGLAVDTSGITSEFLTPPRGQKAPQPDHFVSARTLVEKAGGLPPAPPFGQPNPEENSPQE
jgi:nucleoid DNA-binding protein